MTTAHSCFIKAAYGLQDGAERDQCMARRSVQKNHRRCRKCIAQILKNQDEIFSNKNKKERMGKKTLKKAA
jgi:hypothetical protein